MKITWQNIDDIAELLVEHHQQRDPLSVRFTELRQLVQGLPGFYEEPGHKVNEQILEAIQAAWHEAAQDAKSDGDDERKGFKPNNPFR